MFSKSSKPLTKALPSQIPPGNSLTIISSDVTIFGNLTSTGDVQLDGTLNGDLQCGSLTMGQSGVINGNLSSVAAVIRGRVEGTIRSKSVLLERTAVVTGDVTQESISIEAGAKVDGRFLNRENPHETIALGHTAPVDGNVAALKAVS